MRVTDPVEPPSVQISSSLRSWKIDERRIRGLVSHMAERLGVNHLEIHIDFVGPTTMRKINGKFRNKDRSTDVLSFPVMEWQKPKLIEKATKAKQSPTADRNSKMLRGTKKGLVSFEHERMLGDIIVCLDSANKNAREDGHDVAREVCFLLAHGILHLCGHDHQKPTEKALMFRQQEILMNDAGQNWRACVRRLT
jgi:probable rRNA maturation factor